MEITMDANLKYQVVGVLGVGGQKPAASYFGFYQR
jgi:hypothetical protein